MKCSTSQLDICREGRPGKGRDRRMPGGPEEERRGQHGWEGVNHEEKRSEVGMGEILEDLGSQRKDLRIHPQ